MASKEASDWLGERLGEQRKQVEDAEAKLQRYREQNDAISLEDRENIVVQKLADLNAAVTRAKTERIQKEAMYSQLRSDPGRPGGARHLPGDPRPTRFIQQQKAELAQLQQPAGAAVGEARRPASRHGEAAVGDPERAGQAADGEIGKVVQSVRNEYQAALAQENSLAGALEPAEGRGAGDEPQGDRLQRARRATWRAASSSTTA